LADKPTPAEVEPLAESWTTFPDPAGYSLHTATVTYEGERFWLLKDRNGTVLVFDEHEWGAFLRAAREGEFDHNKAEVLQDVDVRS
jgi:hypothetical protein